MILVYGASSFQPSPYVPIPADMDGNLLADIIYLDRGEGSFFIYQNIGGSYSLTPYGPGGVFTTTDAWAPLGQSIRMIP